MSKFFGKFFLRKFSKFPKIKSHFTHYQRHTRNTKQKKLSKKENNKKGNRDRNIHTDYTDVDITDERKAGLGAGEADLLADGGCEHRTKRSGIKCRNNRRNKTDIQCRTNRRRRAAFTKRLEDKGESQQSRCPNSIWTQ